MARKGTLAPAVNEGAIDAGAFACASSRREVSLRLAAAVGVCQEPLATKAEDASQTLFALPFCTPINHQGEWLQFELYEHKLPFLYEIAREHSARTNLHHLPCLRQMNEIYGD